MAESKEDKRYHSEEKKYYSIEELVRNLFGEASRIIRMDRIYGGDINDAYRMTLSGGEHIFVKANSIRNKDFFLTESRGLGALRSTGEIGVPRFLGTGIDEQRNISFLALEYIESVPRCDSYWETFGHQLARLHRADCLRFVRAEVGSGEYGGEHAVEYEGTKYGFAGDNYIGASPQKNRPSRKWTDFYRECRLLPQFRRAEKYFDSAVKKKVDWLLERLDSWLREPEFPSLLHGDLWSGNMMCGPDGRAWLIDPAAYVGDFETDLAMTQLFGSLPEAFYAAYSEITPIDRAGYRERKRLYDLYQLLNHLNLFGSIYLGSVLDIINWYAG